VHEATDSPEASANTRVLLVDDDPSLTRVLADGLRRRGLDVVECHGVAAAVEAAHDGTLGTVVTDLRMPAGGGLELCRQLREIRPDLPVLVATAFGSLEAAVEVLRVGAYDLLIKPLDVDLLAHAIGRAQRHRAMHLELRRLRAQRPRDDDEAPMVGRSPAMAELRELIARVADSSASVLVTGETGTGKELVARALHRQSGRTGPFIAVNCAAIPEALLESELFGHVRGAFADAAGDRTGLLSRAAGGTILLDEIGDMPLRLQAKLLRVLQERTVRPVGSDEEMPFDARIIAATNRDPETAVAENLLREDLLFRLAVITIEVPPLRARGHDVLDLAQHFILRASDEHDRGVTSVTPQAAERLLAYPWPGNVRELVNCIERAVVLSRYQALTPDDLPPRVREYPGGLPLALTGDRVLTLEEVERRYVRHVLEVAGGNKSAAARLLGIDRKTLLKRL
jgi:DNA-binding NtrC family response regulator